MSCRYSNNLFAQKNTAYWKHITVLNSFFGYQAFNEQNADLFNDLFIQYDIWTFKHNIDVLNFKSM